MRLTRNKDNHSDSKEKFCEKDSLPLGERFFLGGKFYFDLQRNVIFRIKMAGGRSLLQHGGKMKRTAAMLVLGIFSIGFAEKDGFTFNAITFS